MNVSQYSRFQDFAKDCGNRFLAIKFLVRWARDLGSEFSEYHISESKLLDTVFSGRCFYSSEQLVRRKSYTEYDEIEDFLSWTLDKNIVKEVKRAYIQSLRNKKLTLSNSKKFTKGECSKINVLLRMIWYSR